MCGSIYIDRKCAGWFGKKKGIFPNWFSIEILFVPDCLCNFVMFRWTLFFFLFVLKWKRCFFCCCFCHFRSLCVCVFRLKRIHLSRLHQASSECASICQCSSIQLMWKLKLKYKSEVFTLKRPTMECKMFLSYIYILTKDSLLDPLVCILFMCMFVHIVCVCVYLCVCPPYSFASISFLFVYFIPISFHNITFLIHFVSTYSGVHYIRTPTY